MGKFETHIGTLVRGGDQEKKEIASERRTYRFVVANGKRESV